VANLFEQALAQQGISVLGRRIIGAATPATATVVAEHQSAPLQELITPLLKLSNNNMSEALLKAMGRQTANAGTAEAGVAAVAGFMRRQGLDPATLSQSTVRACRGVTWCRRRTSPTCYWPRPGNPGSRPGTTPCRLPGTATE
jgi:hypothetical protein